MILTVRSDLSLKARVLPEEKFQRELQSGPTASKWGQILSHVNENAASTTPLQVSLCVPAVERLKSRETSGAGSCPHTRLCASGLVLIYFYAASLFQFVSVKIVSSDNVLFQTLTGSGGSEVGVAEMF